MEINSINTADDFRSYLNHRILWSVVRLICLPRIISATHSEAAKVLALLHGRAQPQKVWCGHLPHGTIMPK